MPLPPPPPPGPPPPPIFNPPPPPSSKNDPKNQLLSEIRKGTGLKKVVTNDRSAPLIEDKSSGKSGAVANGGPPGLAGLFAGGMPRLKPSGAGKGPALLPPGRRAQDDSGTFSEESGSQSYPSSPQIKSKTTGLPAGFGTVRKGFLGEAMKAHAPQPPPATMKPNGATRPPGPPLPNKPPNVAGVKLNFSKVAPPSNKPPPPPKSPAVHNAVPPALPSKPPSCRRHQSFNEYDVRQGSGNRNGEKRPGVQVKVSPTDNGSGVGSPDTLSVRPPSFKNVSTPNLVAVGKAPPPPPPPARDPAAALAQQYHTMPSKLNVAPPPPPNRTTPYTPKPPPSSRPPPPPPSKIVTSPPTPPPPPPHRVNAAPPPPPPPQQQQPQQQLCLGSSGGRGAPMIPTSSLPPPPPVRNSSARNSLSGSSLTLASNYNGDDLFESRVYHMFLSVNSLPAPDPFTNSTKNYASKNIQGQRSRDAAPPIPTDAHTQLQIGQKLWSNPTTEC